jgi:crotonobetainyl-CoA:carnitine CoA-transferase CaiB-like acyl-CoA transferase
MVMGLFARHRTGLGQHVESAMIVSNIYLNSDDALSYEGKPPRKEVDHLQFGTGATHRLYETAAPGEQQAHQPYENPESRWVFLSAESDEEFARFCETAGRPDLAADERFSSPEGRQRNGQALVTILQDVFATRSARQWEIDSLAAGVGCVSADAMSHFAFLYRDPQAVETNMMVETEHPSFGGTYWRHAPLISFSDTAAEVRPYCEFGEHTRTILHELGYDHAEMSELREAGVVAWPTTEAQALTSSGN